jgi:hypothetical protein
MKVEMKVFPANQGDDSKGIGCRSVLSEFPYIGRLVAFGIMILETAVGRACPPRHRRDNPP